jgi:hypothetical protein
MSNKTYKVEIELGFQGRDPDFEFGKEQETQLVNEVADLFRGASPIEGAYLVHHTVTVQSEEAICLGRRAFEAYNKDRGGVNHRGEKTPEWEELPTQIQRGWVVAAQAVKLHLQKTNG